MQTRAARIAKLRSILARDPDFGMSQDKQQLFDLFASEYLAIFNTLDEIAEALKILITPKIIIDPNTDYSHIKPGKENAP